MKSKFLFPLILIAGLMLGNFSSYQVNGQTPKNKTEKQQTVKYTCPMHPEVSMDKPGKCPKCETTLVKKGAMKKSEMKGDSTMMKHDHKKMMQDSTKMKKGEMKMMHDSTKMKKGEMKM